ncbi:MarR family transcriptional regulator [Bradyrhizobium sp. 62B]|jgi:MarR family transcriptional regulator, organic hydroperoxide resistance regulator|uniref:MarR family winged helix-turn-helix transcriptional regulator n=1 Tax=Bradyrhizobium TaxID=374 RepID=UPI001887E9CA|nr:MULTISPECIES: MarR family transcriptional regulator [Bradyrhizobium]WIW45336.1 MarR family transcriptional regulator [Bradyrhizobium sp. 62B]MBR0699714.1 MarR family transcriptional regulator [Bradyrhizobium diazoefficiens]MBR0768049.1 MarR family transcriptional regulator [Bradyrhizobium diazoefficiens]MBR0928382.1 MarR family transcriptional regulator [Bradyrhizobium diazoefficiens]MCS3762586.1 DNA-binding MarR family transcriptional regulator [Bradyrhizobium centrosematis]
MIEKKLDKAIRDFIWNVVEIHAQLDDIHTSWAGLLGITQPQWLILMAITELDQGQGVAGTDIANKLRVHPAFVTNQTKILEKGGFLSRRPAANDARFVLMSLTAKATTDIEQLSKRRLALNSTMFNDLDEKTLADMNTALAKIAKNARLAARLLAIDVS